MKDDGIWLCEESPKIKSKIDSEIDRLLDTTPTVEAEWSARFWQKFFFKRGKASRTILQRWLERRQLHSESYADVGGSTKQVDETAIQDRYPPVDPELSRSSVPYATEPWVVSKFMKRGYAYSDILYAISVREYESEDFLDDIRHFPTIRLYRNSNHLGGWTTAEIKAFGDPEDREELKDHAIRYSTLTAAVMLHEKLKLCHMASDDPDFFPMSDDLGMHFIAAVGYTAYHYFHCIRDKTDELVKYESYLVEEFDLRNASHRNKFRRQLNLIHVYHRTNVREIELERLRKVVALGKEEVERRLRLRTHKHIRFEKVKREGIYGFRAYGLHPNTVEGIAPTLDTSNSVNLTSDISIEEQVNEATLTLPLRAVNTDKPLAEDLEGTSNDSKSLTLARPGRDRDAVVNEGVVTKGRYGKRKHTCGSTNTRNGNPCKLPMRYVDGGFKCQHYPKHESVISPTAS